jgi:hypothetical protein
VALDDLEAWSHEDSRLRNIVLERAGIKLHPRNAALLVMIAKLKGEGLIKTSRGPTGGSWLTAKGRELVGIYRGGRLRLIR